VIYNRSVGFLGGIPVYSTNKTDHHDITDLLLKVALKTINLSYKNTRAPVTVIH
jgi:hypothetical protein